MENLENKEQLQMSLFEIDKKQDKIDEVIDNLKDKYGYNFITRAGNMKLEENYKNNKM